MAKGKLPGRLASRYLSVFGEDPECARGGWDPPGWARRRLEQTPVILDDPVHHFVLLPSSRPQMLPHSSRMNQRPFSSWRQAPTSGSSPGDPGVHHVIGVGLRQPHSDAPGR